MVCKEKCIELGYEDAIEYGMVKKYAETRGWSYWEIFREIIQNALDEEHLVRGGRPTVYLCKPGRNNIVIYDRGRGLSIRNLLIGVSEKQPWQRGKFGEGLKIALLSAIARGIFTFIISGDKEIKPIFATKVIEGVPTEIFCICYRKAKQPVVGTEVYLTMVNLCERYRRYIIQGLREVSPECIITSIEGKDFWYDVVDKKCTDGEGWIYVRDIYTTKASEVFPDRDACYSYNLFDIKLDESRRIPSPSSVVDDVAKLWKLVVDSATEGDVRAKNLLKNFIRCMLESCQEMGSKFFEVEFDMFLYIPTHKLRVLIEVFNEVYGEDVVVVWSRDLLKLAQYLHIKYIHCPELIGRTFELILDVKSRIKKHLDRMLKEYIPKEKLEPELRKKVEILEEVVRKVYGTYLKDVKILYAVMDPEVYGMYRRDIDAVILNVLSLKEMCSLLSGVCLKHYVSTVGHELAHKYSGANDATPEFEAWLTKLLGVATENSIDNAIELSKLLKKFYELFA